MVFGRDVVPLGVELTESRREEVLGPADVDKAEGNSEALRRAAANPAFPRWRSL